MEAGSQALDYRIKTLERDSGTQHRSIGDLRGKTGAHDTAIAVQGLQLEEHGEDIARLDDTVRDFNKALADGLKEIKDEVGGEMRSVRRSLYAATFTFTALFLTAFGYILQAILGSNG